MSEMKYPTLTAASEKCSALISQSGGSLDLFVSDKFKPNQKNRPWFNVKKKLMLDQRDIFRLNNMYHPQLSHLKKILAFVNNGKIQIWNVPDLVLHGMFSIPNIPEDVRSSSEGSFMFGVRDIKWVGETLIAVALGNGLVEMFNLQGDRLLSEKIGGMVSAMAVSPDFKYFATSTFPGNENLYSSCCVTLYDGRTLINDHLLRPIRRIEGFREFYSLPVTLEFHSDGENLIGVSGKHTAFKKIVSRVEVYSLISGKTKILMEDESVHFSPTVSNIADNGRYCITTPTCIQVYDELHSVIKTFEYDTKASTYPPVLISADGSEIFIKPGKPGVDRVRIDEDAVLHTEMASQGTFYLMPLEAGRALALVYNSSFKPVIIDTQNNSVVNSVLPFVEVCFAFAWDVSPSGDLLMGDSDGNLRHYDRQFQLVGIKQTGRGKIFNVQCNPFIEETAVVTHADAVLTYQPARDKENDTLPVYQHPDTRMLMENGNGTNFAGYNPGSKQCSMYMSPRVKVFAEKGRIFSHLYGKNIWIEDCETCTHPQVGVCKPIVLDEVVIDEAVNGMVFMHGYMLCQLSTRLIAIDPYAYKLQIDADGKKRFLEDGKTVVSILTGLKAISNNSINGKNFCIADKNRLAIVAEDKIMLISISPSLRVKRIKTIRCKNGSMIRYDAFHKRILVYRLTFFSIYTDDLRHIADLYLLSHGRHCVHIPPKSLYFSNSRGDHPGYLWGNGDCSELFKVTDCNGQEIKDAIEKRKIIQSYYNRANTMKGLSCNPEAWHTAANTGTDRTYRGKPFPGLLEYRE